MTTATPGSSGKDSQSQVRQRNTTTQPQSNPQQRNPTPLEKAKTVSSLGAEQISRSSTLIDILRALAGLALISTLASYATTSGASFSWGVLDGRDSYRTPWFLSPTELQARFLSSAGTGGGKSVKNLQLTNEELAAYDGSDSNKPILLALNRTIYDVSASPSIYGPNGMYSTLAAKDASRSYITTCFDPVEDLVPYFGGVEEVYVPLWLSKRPGKEEMERITEEVGKMFGGRDAEELIDEIRKKVGRKNVKTLQKEAYEDAKERVREQVRTWEGMFTSKQYPVVGKVVGVDEVSEEKWRHLGFCEAARKLRPNLAVSLQAAMTKVGKADKMNINMGRMQQEAEAKMKKKKGGKKGKGKGDGKGKEKKEKKTAEGGKKDGVGMDSTDHGWMGNKDHASNDKANVNIEDMMPGGKYYNKHQGGGEKKEKKRPGIVEEKVRQKLEHGDDEKAREDMEQLKEEKDGAQPVIPDAVPDAVLQDEQKMEL